MPKVQHLEKAENLIWRGCHECRTNPFIGAEERNLKDPALARWVVTVMDWHEVWNTACPGLGKSIFLGPSLPVARKVPHG